MAPGSTPQASPPVPALPFGPQRPLAPAVRTTASRFAHPPWGCRKHRGECRARPRFPVFESTRRGPPLGPRAGDRLGLARKGYRRVPSRHFPPAAPRFTALSIFCRRLPNRSEGWGGSRREPSPCGLCGKPLERRPRASWGRLPAAVCRGASAQEVRRCGALGPGTWLLECP